MTIHNERRDSSGINPEDLKLQDTLLPPEVLRARMLVNCVGKVDVFGSNISDEFTIQYPDGTTEGIFKTHAVPVIPFLENSSLDDLAGAVHASQNGKHFIEALNQAGTNTLEQWSARLANSPTRLWQTLEKYRSQTQIADRRLVEIFSELPLSNDPKQRAGELFARMHVAFAYAAPFYHIEAMVGDGQNTPDNPAYVEGGNGDGGGLDIVALALPSAIENAVIAETLDWNGLNWEKIEQILKSLPDDQRDTVNMISSHVDVPPTDVVFAANVLQFIPANVGGKKGDIQQIEASMIISDAIKSPKHITQASVARDMNALIRFLNWFPAVRSQENFDSGAGWNYAAVCDTASDLLNLVSKTEGMFVEGFEDVFANSLRDQLFNLDATSAKGRFLLSLMTQGKFDTSLADTYRKELQKLTDYVGVRLAEKVQKEAVVDALELRPRAMVGGKAAGLAEAALVIQQEHLLGGNVITAEWVTDWIFSDHMIEEAVRQLDTSDNLNTRSFWAHEIQGRIEQLKMPDIILNKAMEGLTGGLMCIRSSSADEDTKINGSAAGIYESVSNVHPQDAESAVKKVISSFFSEKAITYRQLHGLSDFPCMAVLNTGQHFGPGGAIFSSDGNTDISIADSPEAVVSAKHGIRNAAITKDNETLLLEFVDSLTRVSHSGVDMEFIEAGDDKRLIVLQQRTLKPHSNFVEDSLKHDDKTIVNHNLDALSELDDLQVEGEDAVRLTLSPSVNLDQFQGGLFRWLTQHRGVVREIAVASKIPSTCHFANICIHLGIKLVQPQ